MSIAVIAVDLHRGHLDPSVATMPLSAEDSKKVVEENRVFFNQCRDLNIPIVHLLTKYRNVEEILSNPAFYARANDPNHTRKNVGRHNLAGGPGTEVMAELWEEQDILVDTKVRFDCFVATDLDFILKTNKVKTLWITGVNTNSCVIATSIQGSVRDYDVTIVSDCCDTIDGEEYHQAALKIFERAFGKVKTGAQLIEAAKGN
jgi:nicotinamidase-related amidase